MNMTWDLDILYKGYDDPKYANDYKKLEDLISKLQATCANLSVENAKECIEYFLSNDSIPDIVLEKVLK